MKKSSKVIFIIVIVLMLAIIGAGGWYLLDALNKSNNKINELENKITNAKVEEKTETKKINENKPWVYDADYMKENKILYTTSDKSYIINSDECFKVPYININSEDATRINTEIQKLYMNSYNEFNEKANADKLLNCDNITYKYYENDNILSVVVYYHDKNVVVDGGTGGGTLTKYVYNFNLSTLKEATLNEMALVCGFKSDSEVTNKVTKWEENLRNAEKENPSIIEATVNGVQKGKYYINENKKLNFIYRISTSMISDHSQEIEPNKDLVDYYAEGFKISED